MSRLAAVSVLALVLSGCVSRSVIEVEPLGDDYVRRQAILSQSDAWSLSGRMAVRTVDDGFSATLNWQQDGADFSVRLNGPLGVGTVLLDGNPDEVTLRSKERGTEVFTDPERSLRARLGWTVPVTSFRYWALGIESPAIPVDLREVDEVGRLKHLQQAGWNVEYQSYQGAAGADLPRNLTVDNGEVRLKVVIRQWELTRISDD